MVVCSQRKIIFIHIPKTGGTSIEQLLRDRGRYGLQYIGVRNGQSMHHMLAIQLKKEINDFFQHYRFSIVRNPYDRFLSEYFWCPIKGAGYKSGKSLDEFIDYVENVVKKNQYYSNIYHDHFIPQYHFLFYNKKLLVQSIFKFEEFDKIIHFLKNKYHINMEMPFLNKSDKKDISLNDIQKERIYELYKIDFIAFRYDK